MKTVPLAGRRFPLATVPLTFLIHQSLGAWGAVYAAPAAVVLLSELGSHVGINTTLSQGQWILYGTPFFLTQVALALFLGWTLSGTLRHRSMLWVWMLPLLALFLALFGVPLLPVPSSASILFPPMDHLTIAQTASLGFASRLSHFFGWGAGTRPFNQVAVTLPLYSAAAYSLGACLARNVLRTPVFFEMMRSLRKTRLLLFVALPWFCLKLTLNWQRGTARYPALRTWPVLHTYLQRLLMASILLTFVFAIAVSLVGRRFFLSRFFLNPSASPGDGQSR